MGIPNRSWAWQSPPAQAVAAGCTAHNYGACHVAVYMALTLVAEAGILQRLYHSAQQRVTRQWHRQRRRYATRGGSLPIRAGSSGRDPEAVPADAEDEDVKAEREMIQSGGARSNSPERMSYAARTSHA